MILTISSSITKLFLFNFISVFVNCIETFPDGFKFGAATAAYQVEGAWNSDGKGQSMWDWYTHTYPEKVANRTNGDVACDSYHKYEEDIALLKNLGVQFYRLSISWPRILPDGYVNNINQAGVNYYLNILKKLNESGIEPVVTLYHWDLPQSFNELGGWTNPLVVDWFGDYARLCFELFGDYVKNWVTLNEPQTTCLAGYSYGQHAPGYLLSGTGTYLCAYTHVKAHALAYHIYHDEFYERQRGKVSIVLVSYWFDLNANSSDVDKAAQNRALQFAMGLFAHPIYKGNWPQEVIDRVGNRSQLAGYARSRLPQFTQEEIHFINGTHDYFGLNYYTTYNVFHLLNENDLPFVTDFLVDIGIGVYFDLSWKRAASSWLYDTPNGLRKFINWINNEYNHPEILITENGWSDDGSSLNDTDRIEYLQGHLCNVLKAIKEDNANVVGYTHWSIMDNFEWAVGYTERFGTISVNFTDPNRTRTPKQSFYFYQKIIANRTIDCSSF